MVIELLENLIDCLKKQEESLITFDLNEFEQSCLQIFALEKQLKSIFDQYQQNSRSIDAQDLINIKDLQQKIRDQRMKNDLLFKKSEEYLEFLHDQIKYETKQNFVYSKQDFLKRS